MNSKTHVIVGAATCLVAGVETFPSITLGVVDAFPIIGVPAGMLAAQLADYDMSNSRAALHHKLIASMFTHRGMTHTLAFPAAIGFLMVTVMVMPNTFLIQFSLSMILGFLIGYLSHIGADNLNLKGTPCMWPICRERLHVMSITTGTFEETIFLAVYVTLCALQIVFTIGGRFL